MSFKFVFLCVENEQTRAYAEGMCGVVPGLEIVFAAERSEQLAALPGARACFGTLDSELLAAADELGWLAAPAAGPGSGLGPLGCRPYPVCAITVRTFRRPDIIAFSLWLVK